MGNTQLCAVENAASKLWKTRERIDFAMPESAQSKIGKLTFKGLTSLFKNGMKIKKC